MSEMEGQRNDSPLLSERGVTTISDTVVSSLAGMAAQEVDGVHMGGGASRAAGGMLGSITGSESRTSGITVEVGRTETAIDLRMGIEYNKNILQTVEEVRRRITDRVESMTGLRIKELNATITDITFPESESRRRLERAKPPSEPDESQEETSATAPETRATPEDEPAERETTQAETTESETTQADTTQVETTEAETAEVEAAEAETTIVPAEDSGAPEEEATAPANDSIVAEEEVTVEEPPPEESEITEPRTEEQLAEASESETTDESETIEESETTEEAQTPPEPETPEARMKRRAEERARRRRRRAQDS
jgi:uncharacterized alkaline shock family protein YloU